MIDSNGRKIRTSFCGGIVRIFPAERFDTRKFVNLSIYFPCCDNVLLKSTILKFTEYETENF